MFTDLTKDILTNWSYWQLSLVLTASFAFLYFSLTSLSHLFFSLLIHLGICEKVIDRPYFKHQIRFEILHSLLSIVIFGLYGVLTFFCYRNDFVTIRLENDWWILGDLLILILWNEIHFWAVHRLMHTKLLLPFHRTHHRSIVVTPFSTFSFHPIESFLLGSVMILPMLVMDLELIALFFLPIYSLLFNIIGHSNLTFKEHFLGTKDLDISLRHNRHHTKFHVNFGFASKYIDRLFKADQLKKRTEHE